MTFHMSRGSMMRFILRGRRSIWCSWRVTLLAPRNGNDVSYVTRITDEIHFAWQAQYYLLHALEMTFRMSRGSMMRFILRGRRSIWCSWRVTLLAPRIGNDVSYVTRINDEIHFAWQAQYLVQLEGDITCSAHCK